MKYMAKLFRPYTLNNREALYLLTNHKTELQALTFFSNSILTKTYNNSNYNKKNEVHEKD
ncbi:hypothetical protein D0T60_08985 [Bacteroides sp. 224]|nr:hypothetical protein [Bacteroides sp. 224]